MGTDDDRLKEHEAGPPKKPYAKPQLTEYGSVSKLTQSGGSTTNEGAPRSKRGCL